MLARALPFVVVAVAWGCSPVEDLDDCTPRTCELFKRNCGTLPDGCGNTLDCGTCGAGLECSPLGVCREPCFPKTCEELGKNCGFAPDGCDLSVQCGECGAGELCGGGGEDNVCGVAPDACAAGAWTDFGKSYVKATCLYCHQEYEALEGVRAQGQVKLRDAIASGEMPENRSIPAAERQWLLDWIDCGLPE